MTVIAAYHVGPHPLVFGDLLVTGPIPDHERPVTIPAAGEVQEFFGRHGWGIVGMTQKVAVIAPNCALAWAGSCLGARHFISDLRKLSRDTVLTADMIIDRFRNDPEMSAHSADIVGWVVEPDDLKQVFIGAEHVESSVLGDMYIAGTGAPAVRQFAELVQGIAVETNSTNSGFDAVAKSLAMGGEQLLKEFHFREAALTLRNGFGGSYEIAYRDATGFRKLEELTFYFWGATIRPDGLVGLSLPHFVLKQNYWNNFLLLKSCRIEDRVGYETEVIDLQRNVVRPVYQEDRVDEESVPDIPFSSKLNLHCILVQMPDKTSAVVFETRYYASSEEQPVRFEQFSDRLHLSVREDFPRSLIQFISGIVVRN